MPHGGMLTDTTVNSKMRACMSTTAATMQHRVVVFLSFSHSSRALIMRTCPTYLFLQVDPDKAFAVQIKHEESVLTGKVAYMQCAVLFSSSNGERRIRYSQQLLHVTLTDSLEQTSVMHNVQWCTATHVCHHCCQVCAT